MIDILKIEDESDLFLANTNLPKAANVLGVQLGDLEYAQDFGVDLTYFLNPDIQYQNETFKAYLVQRLTESQVNVSRVLDTLQNFYRRYTFEIAEPVDVVDSASIVTPPVVQNIYLQTELGDFFLTEDGNMLSLD